VEDRRSRRAAVAMAIDCASLATFAAVLPRQGLLVVVVCGSVLVGFGLLALRIRRVGYITMLIRGLFAFVLLAASASAIGLLIAVVAEAVAAVLGLSAARATNVKSSARMRSKRFDDIGSAVIHFTFSGLIVAGVLAEGRIGAAVGFALWWIVSSWGTLAVHEAGHAVVARSNGNRVPDVAIGTGLTLFRFGRITIGAIPFLGHTHWLANESSMTSRKELFIVLGGPAANLALASALASVPYVRADGWGVTLICINLGAVLLNVLPFERTFDGRPIPNDGAQALRILRSSAWRT
jgi:hypothetical protein